jgi:hypothetical protein
MPQHANRLLVAWRQPDRLTVPVGVLSRAAGGSFEFSYLKQAEAVEGFRPFAGLDDLRRVYRSDRLFPVIANRLMPRERPDFSEWLGHLGLSDDADIFEILGRSGGLRMTDNVELLPYPQVTGGRVLTRFFVRGIRHLDEAVSVARRLQPGERLTLQREPENQVNPAAVLLNVETGEPVGYVPDYLTGMVHELGVINGGPPEVIVDQVNPDAPPNIMVLVSMSSPCPPDYEPLQELDLQLVAG